MKTPNHYYANLSTLVNECKENLRELFKNNNITSLDIDYDVCNETCADIAYAHVYNEYEGGSVERQVSKVEIDCGCIFVTIDNEDINKRCDYNDECYDFDIFSIYNTCFQILTKKETYETIFSSSESIVRTDKFLCDKATEYLKRTEKRDMNDDTFYEYAHDAFQYACDEFEELHPILKEDHEDGNGGEMWYDQFLDDKILDEIMTIMLDLGFNKTTILGI